MMAFEDWSLEPLSMPATPRLKSVPLPPIAPPPRSSPAEDRIWNAFDARREYNVWLPSSTMLFPSCDYDSSSTPSSPSDYSGPSSPSDFDALQRSYLLDAKLDAATLAAEVALNVLRTTDVVDAPLRVCPSGSNLDSPFKMPSSHTEWDTCDDSSAKTLFAPSPTKTLSRLHVKGWKRKQRMHQQRVDPHPASMYAEAHSGGGAEQSEWDLDYAPALCAPQHAMAPIADAAQVPRGRRRHQASVPAARSLRTPHAGAPMSYGDEYTHGFMPPPPSPRYYIHHSSNRPMHKRFASRGAGGPAVAATAPPPAPTSHQSSMSRRRPTVNRWPYA